MEIFSQYFAEVAFSQLALNSDILSRNRNVFRYENAFRHSRWLPRLGHFVDLNIDMQA